MDINKRLAILGSTGSIGRQTLEVVDEYPQQFEVYLITANNNIDLLIEQARKYRPEIAIIANKELGIRKYSRKRNNKEWSPPQGKRPFFY